MSICVLYAMQCLRTPEDGIRFPGNWSHSPLVTTVWVLGIDPWSSGRAATALYH